MLIALTGTPGTGKDTVGGLLARMGYAVLNLAEIARREGCVVGRDETRESDEVDIDLLRSKIQVQSKIAFLQAHYSHLIPANIAIVLRCRPSELHRRLSARGWGPEKVRENVEAEAIGVITSEAVDNVPFVYEVDTTAASPEETVDAILEILQGHTAGHEVGRVDWSDEVLSWY